MSTKETSRTLQRNAGSGRFIEIGGVKVKLAPAKRVLPKGEDTRLREAVKGYYGDKKRK